MKIGLLGLTTTCFNKGCEALTYSFLEIMKNYNESSFEFYFIEGFCFQEFKTGDLGRRLKEEKIKFDDYGVKATKIFYRILGNHVFFSKNIQNLDICFDFTQGDSFTDIYGQERFDEWTKIKEYIINKGVPLILGSQTIGPFNKEENRNRAKLVIDKCTEVFTRDIDSYNYVKSISTKTPILTTDVAFFLPYCNTGYKESKKIGFNPSGLLWNGGYTLDNQFGLSLDYKEYCRKCISYAIQNGYEVHLIGHVLNENMLGIDNDCVAIEALHKEFPDTIVAPFFKTPMDAKTYISNMAAFTGARMHATIASISAGVPVLPFSYSRKFEGLFNTLNYNYMIHGKKDEIDIAVDKFEKFINNLNFIRRDVLKAQEIIDKMKVEMLVKYKKCL